MFLCVGCSLNPQPLPPDRDNGGDAGNTTLTADSAAPQEDGSFKGDAGGVEDAAMDATIDASSDAPSDASADVVDESRDSGSD
jgi:hypothetical protein